MEPLILLFGLALAGAKAKGAKEVTTALLEAGKELANVDPARIRKELSGWFGNPHAGEGRELIWSDLSSPDS